MKSKESRKKIIKKGIIMHKIASILLVYNRKTFSVKIYIKKMIKISLRIVNENRNENENKDENV